MAESPPPPFRLSVHVTDNGQDIAAHLLIPESGRAEAEFLLAVKRKLDTGRTLLDLLQQDGVGGKLDCEDGPAYIECFPDGSVLEMWCRDGVCDRIGGPATTMRCADGSVIQEWYRYGMLLRDEEAQPISPSASLRPPNVPAP